MLVVNLKLYLMYCLYVLPANTNAFDALCHVINFYICLYDIVCVDMILAEFHKTSYPCRVTNLLFMSVTQEYPRINYLNYLHIYAIHALEGRLCLGSGWLECFQTYHVCHKKFWVNFLQ